MATFETEAVWPPGGGALRTLRCAGCEEEAWVSCEVADGSTSVDCADCVFSLVSFGGDGWGVENVGDCVLCGLIIFIRVRATNASAA